MVYPRNAPPPPVTRFRQGERVCLAVHSDPGAPYVIIDDYAGDRKGRAYAGGSAQVLGTRFEFRSLLIGSVGGWDVICVQAGYGEDKPDKWVWLDHLEPGLYKITLEASDYMTGRTYTLETSFTVE